VLKRVKLSAPVRGSHVRLVAEVPDAGPIWIQVATAGEYKGYSDGPVTFDAAFFKKIVDNFHAHPWYTAGADGVGSADVVPFDYEHASEADPTSGSIPQGGAPAPAWAQELELRTGPDAVAQLWALTRPVNDDVRTMLRDGGYKSTSVAVWRNAVDGLSGNKIGPVLTSIAFTNHPFIQGMEQIAARVDVWGSADSPEELIVGLRDLFEMDENAPPADLQAQLVALGAAYLNGIALPAFPDGVSSLIDRVRRLVGLPLFSTAQQIIEAAGQSLAAVPASTPTTPQQQPAEVASTMALDPKRMARILRLTANIPDEDLEHRIIMAAEQGAASTDAIAQLQALFGSSETKELIAKATEAMTNAEKVKPLMDALRAAQDTIGAQDKDAAEAEVEEVAASLGLKEEARKRLVPVLLSQRTEAGKDATTLAAWRKENGIDPTKRVAAGARTLLTRPMVTGPGGLQFSTKETREPVGAGGAGEVHPLDGYAGKNKVEKAAAYLTDKQPGFKTLPRGVQLFRAGKYLDEGAPAL
jgi:hypothetical protein